MARVDAIPDGQPLTYEVINQIITEVNKIQDVSEEERQTIEVSGPGIRQTAQDTAKIVSGIKTFTLRANDNAVNVDIFFPTPFINDNVVVTANLVDKIFGQIGPGGVQISNITVTEVTGRKCRVRVDVLKTVTIASDLEIHYIAVGPGAAG